MKLGLLVLGFSAGLAICAPTAPAQELKSYEKVAKLIQLTPDDAFEPTTATLVAGELMCPSGSAYVAIISCMAELVNTPDFEAQMKAECMREEARLDCRKTRSSKLVNVLKLYDMLIPGEEPQKHFLAKVDIAGTERYVSDKSLDF
jgi:hypothetical protein